MYKFKEVLIYRGEIHIEPSVYDAIEGTPEFDKTFSTASKFPDLTGSTEYHAILWAEADKLSNIIEWRWVWEDYFDRVKNDKSVT